MMVAVAINPYSCHRKNAMVSFVYLKKLWLFLTGNKRKKAVWLSSIYHNEIRAYFLNALQPKQ